MAARTTIDVLEVVRMANSFMRNSADDRGEERTGVNSFTTSILMKTDNYAGFSYIGGYKPDGSNTRIKFNLSKRLQAQAMKAAKAKYLSDKAAVGDINSYVYAELNAI
jgi:hypothetical protein